MPTPILDKLTAYAKTGPARFHMPGHKGALPPPFDAVAPLDVTELPMTGDLYREGASGAIRQSEAQMARLLGAEGCVYLTGGASQGVFAMLAAAARPGEAVFVDRMCHRSVYHALALLDLRPIYLQRDLLPPWGIPCLLNPSPLTMAEGREPLIYTSPGYYGIIGPKPAHKGPLLCDAAHGAHLPFIPGGHAPPGSVWVVSAHKTLGALGQTACLLTDGTVPADTLRENAAVFGTASPSFALLASLDMAQDALQPGNRPDFRRITDFAEALAKEEGRILSPKALPGGCALDPMKLVLCTGDGTGDAARIMGKYGVIPEMADRSNLVFMLSPHNTDKDLRRLREAVRSIPQRPPVPPPPELPTPRQAATPKEVFWADRERVLLARAAGRTAAAPVAPFPPGTPVLAPGEKIDKIHIEILSDLWYNASVPEMVWVLA